MSRSQAQAPSNTLLIQRLKIFAYSAVVVASLQVIFAPDANAQTKAAKKASPAKTLPAASPEQMEAFNRAHVGEYQCELGQSLTVSPHATPGYLEVGFKRYKFTMKPVLSSTGAIRLEDVADRALMVQIANKSMLLDNKVGQRLVDECVHPQQRSAADAAKAASTS